MITIDETLDSIMKLDFSSREILLEILQKRQVQERRAEIEKNAKQAKAAFKSGKLKSLKAKDAISILNSL